MQVLYDWLSENKNSSNCNSEYVAAVKNILAAIEAHVVENNDGYSVGNQGEPPTISALENDVLRNARTRHLEQLQAMKELANRIGLDQEEAKEIENSAPTGNPKNIKQSENIR